MKTAISAIIVFCVIIFIHELGHFITAKLAKITVHEFSIGMGPRLFGFNRGGTLYSVRLLPIGGFVQLEGEDGQSDDVNAFGNKSAFARFIVLASGAIMNFILGFILFLIIVGNAKIIPTTTVAELTDNSAFAEAGIQSGDKIVKMQSDKYTTHIMCYDDISLFGGITGYSPCKVTVMRNGEKKTFSVTPVFSETDNRHLYGFKIATVKKNVINTVKYAAVQSVFTVKIVYKSFAMLLGGKLGANDVSGPVGIVSEIGNAARNGILYLINITALITVNLGVVNLLPLPALDGGRIYFILLEKIRRKRLTPEQEGTIHTIGFVLLMILMLVVTFFDISKLV